MGLLDFSIQHCFLAMTEKLQKSLVRKETSAVLLVDRSKGFDCMPHDLLIAKLHAYRVKDESLNLFFSYFKLENKEFI